MEVRTIDDVAKVIIAKHNKDWAKVGEIAYETQNILARAIACVVIVSERKETFKVEKKDVDGKVTEVVEYAKGISKNQKNKYIRYGKIPKVFFKYLDTIFESDHNAWEYLRLDLIEEACPGLNDKPVDSSEMLYKMIEENLRLHGAKHLR